MNTLGKLLLCLFLSSLVMHKWMTVLLQQLWDYSILTRLVQHETCEVIVAAILIVTLTTFYDIIESIPYFHQYRIDYKYQMELNNTYKLCKANPFQNKYNPRAKTATYYNVVIYLFDLFFPRNRKQNLLLNHRIAPHYFIFIAEVTIGIFLYDLIMYSLHYLQHHFYKWIPNKYLKNFVRTIHNDHHAFRQTIYSGIVAQFSFIDIWMQLVVNIFVQNCFFLNIYTKHPLSRLAHNVIIVYLLIQAHSGFDFFFMSHNLYPKIFGGSIRHNLHHLCGNCYYHQFFMYIDDYFGFTLDKQQQENILKKSVSIKTEQRKQQNDDIKSSPIWLISGSLFFVFVFYDIYYRTPMNLRVM